MSRWLAIFPALLATISSFAATDAKPALPSAAERMQQSFPVGIMPAYSFAKESDGKLTLEFASLAFVGLGPEVEGRMIRSNLEIARDSNDHEFVRQYWVQADGTARKWLAVEYEYTRRK